MFIYISSIIENIERESNHMEISYNRLFKLLIDKGMKKLFITGQIRWNQWIWMMV